MVPMLSKAKEIKIVSVNGAVASYSGEMDKIVLNDGNFEGNTNYGSKYPIGEIVTEALDLSTLNGEIEVYAFPNLEIETEFVEPFKIEIKDGLVVSHNGPKNFVDIVNMIKTEHPEEKVYVREFGIGINRHIHRHSRLGDPISYERQEGLHFSLGMKHGIYEKKLHAKYGKKFYQRYHIDVYVNLDKMYIDNELVYEKEKGYLL
jgi:leucyl aminopeptidase (aminopeptidase T)